ncbi:MULTISPECIES: glycosyltransferase family 2 protein [Clostridium]|uniref:Glycosyltransferase family 2 protein n=1 Tax=Clostridium saudiense TaxID=1414720 RepID=A0ABS2FFE8_9CLOT|nr:MULTISPECIES: glycosyltransferase family 2 protein [Clostridium]MDU2290179.1 glycosyltransferase family 2 protein [Clostridium celatum]MBM6819036.1 glycosyltransferase family 2 protein [Clostridium saudiense]MBX9138112.1 glycosyltransferase family 2 protein [Clostridium sp. K12(2020)]MBX9144961.1 glycosyltransferase family 2 protein [Clostridium sp. K13]MDU4324333.1 glycosyltransferase family 2 protein [Clostridium celatum]
MNSVAAVIITYNVENDFKERINKLKGKVDEIIVVDNGSKAETINMLKELEKEVTVIYLEDNKGIASALNKGIKYSIEKGYNWILTLDHDSIITDNMIKNMLTCYEGLNNELKEKVAMLVPVHVEEKEYQNGSNINEEKDSNSYIEVLTEITSGALTKAEIYKNVGMYDEKLFIDLVDHDYCLSLNKKGFKIIQVNNATLIHNLGESVKKSVLGLKMIPTNHSPLRRYYMSRNRHYIWDKYKEDFPSWVLTDKRRFITENLKIVLFEDNKIEKFKYIKKGIKDYRNNIFGKFNN